MGIVCSPQLGLMKGMLDIIEGGHFTWEDAADEYAALALQQNRPPRPPQGMKVPEWWAYNDNEMREYLDDDKNLKKFTGGATNFRQRTTLPVTSSISSINSSAITVRSVSLKAHLPFRFTQTRDARALYGKRRI